MARKLYPIGIQTFERIRKEDKFYIDKTEYVYRMTHTDGTYFFLNLVPSQLVILISRTNPSI